MIPRFLSGETNPTQKTSPSLKMPKPALLQNMTPKPAILQNATLKPTMLHNATLKPPILQNATPKPTKLQNATPKPAVLHNEMLKPAVIQTAPGLTQITSSKAVAVKSPSVTSHSNVTSTGLSLAAPVHLPISAQKILSITPPATASNVTRIVSPRIIANKPPSVLSVTPSPSRFNVTLEKADGLNGVFKLISSFGKALGNVQVLRK